MPVYNCDLFVSQAIESILSQTMREFEFLIINDGSTDNSAAIINTYISDPRIKIFTNNKALGKAGDAAKEIGISHAKGKYIAIMDADDIALVNRLERQFEFMEANADVFLCGSWANYIDNRGEIFHEWKPVITHEQIVSEMALKNSIMHSTFFFRNDEGVKPFYETKYVNYNDYYTQFKLIKQGKKLANIPEILMTYRVSGESTTQNNAAQKLKEYFKVRREISNYPLTKATFIQKLKILIQTIAIYYLPSKLVLSLHPVFKKVN